MMKIRKKSDDDDYEIFRIKYDFFKTGYDLDMTKQDMT